jgi:uncharacterized protein (TIGR03382 family)
LPIWRAQAGLGPGNEGSHPPFSLAPHLLGLPSAMRSLLIALTLTSSAAFGQTTGILVLTTPTNETSLRVPKEPCDLVRTVNWTYNGVGPCSDLEFWIQKGGSCDDKAPSGAETLPKVALSTLTSTRSGSVSFEVGDLPGFSGTDAVTCPADNREDEYRLCGAVKQYGGTFGTECSTTPQKDDVEIVYDAKPPDAPTLESVQGLDKALSVRVDAPDDASEIKVTVTRTVGEGSRTVTQSADQTLFRVEGLENNVTYSVTAVALDEADNESAASEALEGTPILTKGFFDRYVDANGQEMGGCAAAGMGLAGGWVLAVLGFWLSSRRNRS